MAKELVYQMFFKPTMVVPPTAPTAATRLIRINVYYNPIQYINVIIPDTV